MKKLYLLLALLLATPAFHSASADTFNFDFSSADFSGSGTLSANPTSTPGQYLIYDASGSVNTGASGIQAITSVIPAFPSPASFQANDNFLFFPPSPGFFDLFGFSFALANGAEVNLFYDQANGGSFLMDVNGMTYEEDATIHVTAVTPEPSSWILLGTGAAGVAGTLRRRILR